MDEDDIKEFGADQIQENYDALGTTERELLRKKTIQTGLVDQVTIIETKREVGCRLLIAMGWKEKEPIGPKKKIFPKAFTFDAGQPLMSTYGRGYDPLANAPEFQSEKLKKKKNLPMGGFGTGIFDEDDEVPFYEVPEEDYFVKDEEKYELNARSSKPIPVKQNRLTGFSGGSVVSVSHKSYSIFT
jgi:hypothetical protein